MQRKTRRYPAKGDTDVAILPTGSTESIAGKLLDESSHGICALVDSIGDLSIDHRVRIRFRRQNKTAVVKSIGEHEAGYSIGLQLVLY